jgi:hypothetical protein
MPLAAEYDYLDAARTAVADNLWDGINRNNELQVSSDTINILVEGFEMRGHYFGTSPRVGDVDGDGKPELVVGDGKGFVWIYPLGPPGQPRAIKAARFVRTFTGDATTIGLADVNADNQTDIVIGNMLGVIGYLRNRGKGEFTSADYAPAIFAVTNPIPLLQMDRKNLDVGSFSAPLILDWDRDGKLDVITGEGSYSANAVYLYRNRGGSGTFQLEQDERYWLMYGEGKEQLVPAVGDLNGDGQRDMIVGDRLGNLSMYIYEDLPARAPREKYLLSNKGLVPFADGMPFTSPMCRPELTDWDGDGDLDLLIGTQDAKVLVALNTGSAKEPLFAQPTALKALDVLKPLTVPVGWNLKYSWYRHGLNPHNGAYLQMTNDLDEAGQNVRFVRYAYVNEYFGMQPCLLFTGQKEMQLDKIYTLEVKVRATAVTDMEFSFVFGERGRGKGDTLRETWPATIVRMKPSSNWQIMRKGFKVSSVFGKDRVETGNPNVDMRLIIHGRPNLVCDIASIAVTAGGTIAPTAPAPANPAAPKTTPAKKDDKKPAKKDDKKNDK